jgi:seryl-tRNA synthetase
VLDLKFVRAHPDLVRDGARRKRIACDVERILALDHELRALKTRLDEERARQRSSGKEMAAARPDQRAALQESLKALKAAIQAGEAREAELEAELRELLVRLPNPPGPEVPDGKDDGDNVELRRWGSPPRFDFEPRDHVALAEAQGWLHPERAGRIAGARNYILTGDLALLEHAVMRWAFDHMVAKGFVPVCAPVLVRPEAMFGTGYFPGGEEQAYRCDERDELVLAGTAEVPLTALHAGEILDHRELPKRYVAQSSCYRREAGAAGKDTRGLYRVHQFQKVEQVIVDVADEARSIRHHAEILRNSEELLEAFGLAYRVVNVCTGDLGAGQVQKFDLETWMPSRGGYGETHSASRFHDWQARRLELRYRDAEGRVHVCHTLNNTVAASARLLIALIENGQRADGTVAVPAALAGYLGGRASIGRPLG